MTQRKMSPQQKSRIGQCAADAANSLGLTRDQAQRVIADKDFQGALAKLILEHAGFPHAVTDPAEADSFIRACVVEFLVHYRLALVGGKDEPSTLRSMRDLDLVDFPSDQGSVSGRIMMQYALENRAMLGLSDAARVMWVIRPPLSQPPIWGRCIVFAGTTLLDEQGRECVPYVYADYDDRLHWAAKLLDEEFPGDHYCLARHKSARTQPAR